MLFAFVGFIPYGGALVDCLSVQAGRLQVRYVGPPCADNQLALSGGENEIPERIPNPGISEATAGTPMLDLRGVEHKPTPGVGRHILPSEKRWMSQVGKKKNRTIDQ